jgi:AcrR family transcriptional regulator
MAIDSPSVPKSPARGRRSARASGDERERAILETAEHLLEERPLSEISVADLAAGAGISRPSFYFYFASRDAVLMTLVDRMVAESAQSRAAAVALIREDPRAGLREGLQASFDSFRSRRGVILAAAELRAGSNEDARGLWSQVMESWVSEVSAVIEAERARGTAPPGPPARELAIALVQMNERSQHATLAGETPSLSEERTMDVLVEIWLRAIYGAET